jgi:hypothetical protein
MFRGSRFVGIIDKEADNAKRLANVDRQTDTNQKPVKQKQETVMSTAEHVVDHVDLNFDEIPDASEVIPLGTYTAKIVEVTTGLKTMNGDVKWKLTVKIVAGKYAGETIKDSISFGNKARKRVSGLMKAVGLEGSKGLTSSDLLDKLVDVVLEEHRKWTFKGKEGVSPVLGWDAYHKATQEEEDVPF